MNYNLTTIRKRGFLHSSAFKEVIDSLAWSLCALGHAANVSENWISNDETNIVFGCELLASNQPQSLPRGTIIYNLEQCSQQSFFRTVQIAKFGGHIVWDYSLKNIEKWKEQGIAALHVPVGYTPNLTRIPKADRQDIDCLLYGWMTPRRVKLVDDLRAAGLHVIASDRCYGGGRDNLIARSKIVLNVHHDGRDMLEIVRISYLLANAKFVITEPSSDDEEYHPVDHAIAKSESLADLRTEHDLHIISCPYEKIVEVCQGHIYEGLNFNRWGQDALNTFKTRDYTESVRKVLETPTPAEFVASRYRAACQYGDMKDFAEWIRDHAKGTCLEIGTRDGASTSALLSGVEKNGGVVLSVDVDDCSHLFRGHPQWKFLRSSSQNPKLTLKQEDGSALPLDLLLIDGDHTREGYKADLQRFYPFVKPGGLILTHDIHPEPGHEFYMEGLREEFFSFAQSNKLEHYEVPGYAGLGVMIKPDVVDSDESWQASEAILVREDYEKDNSASWFYQRG